MLICIDPGHGGTDPGAVSFNGYLEKNNTLAIAKEIKKQGGNLPGVDFIYTRLKDELLAANIASDLKARAKIANDTRADIFISIHQNADPNQKGRGVETFYFSTKNYTSEKGKKLAGYVQKKLVKATGLPDRGIKPGRFYVLRHTVMPAILVEAGFVGGDPQEAKYVSQPATIEKIASAILRGAAEYLGVEYHEAPLQKKPQEPAVEETPIIGKPEADNIQAKAFIAEKASQWVFLVDIYYSIAPIYGVRADIALAQACKETNYFKFTGAVKPDFNNYCGLKTATAKGDAPLDHARFPDPETGVEAHIQHLYCYATKLPLPEGCKMVDPRFDIVAELVGRGIATTVEQLGGKWAPNPDYGRSIVNNYLRKILSFSPPSSPETGDREKLLQEISKLKKKKQELTNKVKNLQDEVNKKNDKITELESEINTCQKKLTELANKVGEMSAKLKEIAEIVSSYG